ncbi:MAG: LacI family DNA-binding transcriptional regulator [candidate division KSB1 bacterium]|nr:LacI family DNA-binding transcriptional regulator [candidate division KSB1 bacterium]
MNVTIYDVAKKAGVGIGTVSRVINNSPHLSIKTKLKVEKVIKELKYQPHAMAQSLARKKTNTVACIVPDFTGYFFVEMLCGIQRECSTLGYDLILYSVDEIEKKEMFLKRTLREKKVDGVLFLSLDISDKEADRFIQADFPIVLVDSFHPKLDSIMVENEEGAFLATDHLLQLGHRKVGVITGHLDSVPANVRLEGYKRALNHCKIQLNDQYISISSMNGDTEERSNHGFNKKAGYNAMMRLLDKNSDPPTAVFVSSDIQALGAINAVMDRGLKVPEDIAIVGFDDIELAAWVGLSTMRQPMAEMGSLAVSRLFEKIQQHHLPTMNKLFTPKLIVRESSGDRISN